MTPPLSKAQNSSILLGIKIRTQNEVGQCINTRHTAAPPPIKKNKKEKKSSIESKFSMIPSFVKRNKRGDEYTTIGTSYMYLISSSRMGEVSRKGTGVTCVVANLGQCYTRQF